MQKEQEQHIEEHLSQVFQRVVPSRAFVNTVRERIQHPATPIMIENFPPQRKTLLLTLGGVLSVSLFLLTLARIAYYLIGRSKQAA
jgi:hypothetical protein